MFYNIDLHIHTNASNDGSFSPKEIVDKAINKGIKTIAIADHNTCKGVIEAQNYISSMEISNIKLLPAIEIDCVINNTNLHVLGYGIDVQMQTFSNLEKYMEKIEFDAGVKLLDNIQKLFKINVNTGYLINKAANNIITGEVIAEELLTNDTYKSLECLIPYQSGGARADNPYVNFYWDYCSQGKEAYVPIDLIQIEQAINIIRQAGGVPVLAHPGNNIHEDLTALRQILDQGVIGIEAISSYHTKEQIDFYMSAAREFGLIVTCGSDFHGKTKPSIDLGEFNYQFNSEVLYQKLIKKL